MTTAGHPNIMPATDHAQLVAEMAIEAAYAQLSIIPIDWQTKQPPMVTPERRMAWKQFQTIAASNETVMKWCGATPAPLAMAVVCGKVSGGRVHLDFDVPELYPLWLESVGSLADGLPVVITGRGGYHVIFNMADPVGNLKLAWIPDDAEETGRKCAIETRGEGGYAVLHTSLHPSGKTYEIVRGDPLHAPTISKAHADALLDAARKLCHAPQTRQDMENAAKHAKECTRSRLAVNGQGSVIDQFNQIHAIAETLERYSYRPGAGGMYIRPGKDGPFTSVTVRDGRSFHHSSNDQMSDGYWHRPFDIFCKYAHAGDCKAAVKAAADQMGLSRPKPIVAKSLAQIERPSSHPDPMEAFNAESADVAHVDYEPVEGGYVEAEVSTQNEDLPAKPTRSKAIVFPNPIPLDAPRAPELPAGIFTHWLGEMIDAVAESVEVPPELPATFALAAVSTVCQRRFSVRVSQNYFEPVNVWLICAMASGNRKTESMKRMILPLAQFEQQQAAELLPVIEKTKSERKTAEARISKLRADAVKAKPGEFERLSAELAEIEAALPEIQSIPQLFTQDVTPEHTGTMLADNGQRLSLISDEGGIVDIMAGRYSNGIPNLDVYLQSHAGSFVRVNRGSRPPVNLTHPALTIAISPQPDVLRGLTSHKGFRGRGLLARFAYTVPPSKLGYRTNRTVPIPDEVARRYQEGIFALAATQPIEDNGKELPHVLTLSPDAYEVWQSFWNEIETMMRPDGRLEHLTDWGGKLPGMVARVAGLLHCVAYTSCATTTREIESGTMERAIRFGRYLIEHAMVAFSLMGANPAMEAARDLWRIIEKNRQSTFSVRDAWNPLRSTYKTVADAEPGFDILIDHGYIAEPHQVAEMESPRRKGRPPSRVFNVNPKLMENWQ